ncbi:DUF1287 domain-containing protein [Pseudomonas sp. URMO17WK12:I2]|uniref:DUF1287 domain-containing protein n=1 Tax=Pseudomonas sp. URMO17WK12:I2 TaxID=1261623 RepID=UPI000DAF0D8A|nr:hypothetical protein F469_04540 [Pseudomonas sp. URMO17WK12:I2]
MLKTGLLLLGCLLSLQVAAIEPAELVSGAREQVGVTLSYDPAYRRIGYPGGDVPMQTGVCTDVVIRALRLQGLDLQKAVHEDMAANFSAYPKQWGLKRPDRNIDHRRVPNLMTWFKRQGMALAVTREAGAYRAGDIVTWDLGRGQTHIGIVSDRLSAAGEPLILHNIGAGTREEAILFRFPVTGHYRFPPG